MGGIKQFWRKQNTLERKMFWYILILVAIVATFSAIFTIYEELGMAASLASIGCSVLCLAVGLVAVRTSLYDQCYLVLCCMLSCFLLPLLFFFCGGITSGMPLYCVTVFSLLSFAKASLAKTIAMIASLVVIVGAFFVSWMKPDLVLEILNREESYLDILVSLVFSSVTLYCVGTIYTRVYAAERDSKEALLAKLDDLSKRDPLTNVFNRRYLDDVVGVMLWRKRDRAYVLMLDVDNLKDTNKSYGRAFGDQVLVRIAGLLSSKVNQSHMESVSRYGGGTFVCVLESDSEGEALSRSEALRQEIAALRFETNSLAQVTVSGGFVYCGDRSMSDFRSVLEKADELSEISKSLGQNVIRSLVRT